jgi:hypothetical protein
MPTLTLTGNTRLTFSLADTQLVGSVTGDVEVRATQTVANGTGSGQANVAWATEVTLAAGQVYSLDLTNLSASAFGYQGKVSVTTLRDVIVVNNETTANRYLLYGVISAQDTTGYAARINRGGSYRWTDYQDGIAVTAGNKTLYIANPSGGSVTFDIALAGVGSYSDNS